MTLQTMTRLRLASSLESTDLLPDTTLLAAIEQAGWAWPGSCRNGTCRTCVGRLLSGSVVYRIDWPGLSADELADGLVLPCVAYGAVDGPLSRMADGGPGPAELVLQRLPAI